MWRILSFILFAHHILPAQNAWINEFHYDNSGVDQQEFIEIIAADSLTNLKVYLYNGVNGLPYDSVLLDTLSGIRIEPGFNIFTWQKEGIQNGPDGFALTNPGGVIDFLSYEGDFMATGGPATGRLFSAIPVSETGTSPPSYSLQRTGPGSRGPHFKWKLQMNASPGALNDEQILTFAPTLMSFGKDTLSFGTVPFGSSSAPQSYEFTAVNNSSDINLYPPPGYEISLQPDFSTVFTYLLPLTMPAETDFIPYQTVYVRFNPPAPDGLTYNDVIIHDCPGTQPLLLPVRGTEGIPEIPNMWINEFHYDNASIDTLEFVEIVIVYPERYSLDDLQLTLYNGSNGTAYRTLGIEDAWTGQKEDPGFQLYVFPVAGIQNGAPDGIALSFGDFTNEFISYEGIFTANDGPASGITSHQVMPEEDGATPALSSIQRFGKGDQADSFEWVLVPGNHTMGKVNLEQILPVNLLSYTTRLINNYELMISWSTSSAPENYGFVLETSGSGGSFDSLEFIPSNVHGTYSTILNLSEDPFYLRIRQLSFSGVHSILLTDRIPFFREDQTVGLMISNGHYTLRYPTDKSEDVVVTLFNSEGKRIRILYDRIEKSELNLTHWLEDLSGGMYFIQVQTVSSTHMIRFIPG